jgi:dienelactone hydrolase
MRAALAVLALLAGAAAQAETITIESVASGEKIPATLFKPDGEGPFPAVVIAHDCSGLGPRSSGRPKRWAEELVAQGYVVVLPDSFSARGLEEGVCIAGVRNRERATYPIRAQDAHGALLALRALPYVDGARIGVMGGSHGGSTTLTALLKPGFAAGIALYPRCDWTYGAWSIMRRNGNVGPMAAHYGTYAPAAPLYILAGELDDWTPAEACRVMTEKSRAAGHPVEIKIYPGAHHSFDGDAPERFMPNRANPSAPSGRGATTAGNPEAWADAKREVVRFFGEKLKR